MMAKKKKPYNLLRKQPYNPPYNPPIILPDDNSVIPSMTAKQFNELQEELDIEYFNDLQDLIEKLKKEHDE